MLSLSNSARVRQLRLAVTMLGLIAICGLNSSALLASETESGPVSIKDKIKGMTKFDGFFPIYWAETEGKLYLEIANLGEEFLYVGVLATGVGSNPLGLDRGRIARERVVRFERIGPRILLSQRNLEYRALDGDAYEKKAVAESFASSVLWGGDIVAVDKKRVLVDITGFVLSDAADIIGRLDDRDQGSFSLDLDRSALYLPHTRAYPDNTEMEATLTFVSNSPGRLVRETTPTPEAITVRQRHSFIRLPDDNYSPRQMHPRCGTFSIEFADYSTPLDRPLRKRWVIRHRLEKKNSNDQVSTAIEPIVYYVDRAIPEPIRSAVLDGAGWWSEAFEAAGFKDAFRVELAPEGMDYLDLRNNIIQWVHRSTRGWSYGRTVIDPRTGEILKGHVSLGSLRVRQDRLLMEGLTPQYDAAQSECAVGLGPTGLELAAFDPMIAPTEVALARIRQLACHEVGHTLGFAHNFAASTYDRGSVMDYPAPLARITADGNLDLSDAYGVGVGVWDKLAARYVYTEFGSAAEERTGLATIIAEAIDNDLLFISDGDSRSAGSAHPLSNLWDNGADPIAELDRIMKVRRLGLEQFSEKSIPNGEPLALLEEMLVPLYLSHRYQLEATARSIGGVTYTYTMRGDGQTPMKLVPAARQRLALKTMLKTLSPSELKLSDKIVNLLPPHPFGYYDDRERFASKTTPMFDPLAVAQVAAEMVVDNLLQPERAARLIQNRTRDDAALSFGEVVDRLLDVSWNAATPVDASDAALARVVERVVVNRLIKLAGDASASTEVRSQTEAVLNKLVATLSRQAVEGNADAVEQAHHLWAKAEIVRFLNRPHHPAAGEMPLAAPPGSPIGN